MRRRNDGVTVWGDRMGIGDETWKRALDCAAGQFEGYARRGQLSTPEERRKALDDALQHAIGIIQLEEG